MVSLGLVAVAGALTVPWSYLVLRAAYDRDIAENAKSLARRVEQPVQIKVAQARARGINPWRLQPRQVIDEELFNALAVEMRADPAIRAAVFYFVQYDMGPDGQPGRPVEIAALAPVRGAQSSVPGITAEQIGQLTEGPMEGKDDDAYRFLLPWKQDGRVRGATYVELSRDRISHDFWTKEGPLLKRVVAWTATAFVALSVVGIFGYHAWQRAGAVQRKAEMEQQGMMAERGLTAAVLAHEIRNPLAALRFQLHSLKKNAENPGKVGGTAEMIDSELLRIQQLVSDYLAHEKAVSLRVQSVDLAEAAQRLKGVMEEMLRSTATRLTVATPGQAVEATCDPHALRQILMNLVLNAQQAMGSGGSITITVGRSDDGFGTIDVADTGPGIPEEMRERLFKPFQTTKVDGHGIGLALVKRFVDNFGGSVAVESEVGRGTTFRLRLPLAEGSEERMKAEG